MKRIPGDANEVTTGTECWQCHDTGYIPDYPEFGEDAGAECGLCDQSPDPSVLQLAFAI